jgi:hypothetical protein
MPLSLGGIPELQDPVAVIGCVCVCILCSLARYESIFVGYISVSAHTCTCIIQLRTREYTLM